MEADVLQGPEEYPLVSETDLWLIASKKTRTSVLQSQETKFWKCILSSDDNEVQTIS